MTGPAIAYVIFWVVAVAGVCLANWLTQKQRDDYRQVGDEDQCGDTKTKSTETTESDGSG
jgi:hypothetical protein